MFLLLIYSLLDIFSQLPKNIELKLVGNGDNIQRINDKVKVINFTNNEKDLIKLYDLPIQNRRLLTLHRHRK